MKLLNCHIMSGSPHGVLVSRVILLTTFDSANVNPVAFSIALLALHIVTIADLLAIWGVSNQLQLSARQIAGLALVLSFLTFALSFVALLGGSCSHLGVLDGLSIAAQVTGDVKCSSFNSVSSVASFNVT